jgi:RHS repeat-associated protein
VTRERREVHLLDDKRRIAIHRWVLAGKKPQESPEGTHYQMGNHLDSASIEVNENGELITYEEYYPYGGTSLVAGRSEREVREKEYRYSGKERDSHTGLYYYGARYYAPWLGRWLNPDPAGPVDGMNLYFFVGNNPIRNVDPTGNKYRQPIFKGFLGKKGESPMDKLVKKMDDPKVKAMLDKGMNEAEKAYQMKLKEGFDVANPTNYLEKEGLKSQLKDSTTKQQKQVFDFDVRVVKSKKFNTPVKFGKADADVSKYNEPTVARPRANAQENADQGLDYSMVIHGSFDLGGLGHVITQSTEVTLDGETSTFDLPVTNYKGTGKLGMKQNEEKFKKAEEFYSNFESILISVDLSKAPDELKEQYADRMEDGKVALDVHELANMSVVLGLASLGKGQEDVNKLQKEVLEMADPPPLQRRHTL